MAEQPPQQSMASRRQFMKTSAVAANIVAAPMIMAQSGGSDTVNVAVVGIHGRGRAHIQEFAKVPNTKIVALCDVDSRLFPEAVKTVQDLQGHRPDTVEDFRKLIERKDIHAVSIATPDYWHALQTIWACQAGKDVYVEKPVSFTIVEGRRMVEAARKYNRIVQTGLNRRSIPSVRDAVRFAHSGALGKIYRGRMELVKPRGSMGRRQEASVPDGGNWDLYLGPTPMKAFKVNQFHYGWHFFWDTSTTDVGNTGVHHFDVIRWAQNINTHPTEIYCTGGMFVHDSDQNVPNFQTGAFTYADGTVVDFEALNLLSPEPRATDILYADHGYIASSDNWKAVRGNWVFREGPDVTPDGIDRRASKAGFPRPQYEEITIPKSGETPQSHFANFIQCVRTRKVEDLRCDILEGHLSSTMAHLANISFRLKRALKFNPDTERFINDPEADAMLTRKYREPYSLPDRV